MSFLYIPRIASYCDGAFCLRDINVRQKGAAGRTKGRQVQKETPGVKDVSKRLDKSSGYCEFFVKGRISLTFDYSQ
jgi:hypothetical protein